MIRRTVLFLIFPISLLFLNSCSGGENTTGERPKIDPAFFSEVRTVKATVDIQHEELLLAGKVEYDMDKVINYVPLVSGIIDRAYFMLGDRVEKGESLLDIRSSELSAMHSDYLLYESELKIADREMKAAQTMYDDNMLSDKELLEVQSRLNQTQAFLEKVKSDLLPYSFKSNGIFSISAPMSGYIVKKNASPGTPVSSDSSSLFVIADLSSVWIVANVYAGNIQFVREGMDVEITTLSYPDEVFHARINRVSQVFDSEERVLKVTIFAPNKELKFKPEMAVVVKLKSENDTKVVAVPSDAIIFDQNRNFVVVEALTGEFEIREVELQGQNNNTTYIRSGMNENENIVIKEHLLIYSQLKDQ